MAELANTGPPSDDAVVHALYQELRRRARACMRGERPDHTLAPTALAHEAWLRLVDQDAVSPDSPAAFLAAASRAMRRILVEHSRRKRAWKRGGDRSRVDVPADELPAVEPDAGILELDAALEQLARIDSGKARLVELRFFAGLSIGEAARLLGMSERTAARDWRLARAFLRARLPGGTGDDRLDA